MSLLAAEIEVGAALMSLNVRCSNLFCKRLRNYAPFWGLFFWKCKEVWERQTIYAECSKKGFQTLKVCSNRWNEQELPSQGMSKHQCLLKRVMFVLHLQ